MQLPTVTKAVSVEEDQITKLWLYMFDESDKLIYQVSATVPVGVDVTKAVTANLKATKESVTLMALANVDSETFALQTSKADVLKAFEFDAPDNRASVSIPMWGEVELPNGLYTDDASIKIPMTRSMACVEVLVDEQLVINFDLEEVYLVGTYNKGFVAPINVDGLLQKNTISVPADATGSRSLDVAYYKKGLTNLGAKFYVPESLLTSETLPNGEIRRSLCMIIGGNTTIDGEDNFGYYRLDFLYQNTINEETSVKRNTRYVFKIDAVHEFGGEDVQTVFEKSIPDNASRISVSTEIMTVGETPTEDDCIEKGLNDITTDGVDYLAVNNSNLKAIKNIDGMYYAKIQIFTNNSDGWKMIDMPEGIIAQQKSGAANVFYETFIWIKPEVTNPLFYIKAGGVWKTITITLSN